MATTVKQLPEEALEKVRHMLRRDANSDLAIARFAEQCAGRELWPSDAARQRAIARYRQSAEFKRWRERFENQDIELKRQIAVQKEAFAFVREIVGEGAAEGATAVSRGLLARALTVAARCGDEELVEGLKGRGYIASLIKLVQEQARLEKAALREKVAAAVDEGAKKKATPEELVAAVDKVMGLA
jgi:hypothetical protein